MNERYVPAPLRINENFIPLSRRDFTNHCVSYLKNVESEKNLFNDRLHRTIERLRNQNNDIMATNSNVPRR